MVASYVGHMAPASRVTLAALFQSADELRRIERIACGMCLVRDRPAHELDAQSRQAWQTAPAWQPLREATERLLVSYDWGEALVGLNLCLKPVVDEVAVGCLLDDAQRQGDPYWSAALAHAYADCRWQRRWTAALVRETVAQNPANRDVIGRWLELWGPRALLAVEAIAALLPDPAAALQRARSLHGEHVASALAAREVAGA
jgi:toluene monooxygenase system protein E